MVLLTIPPFEVPSMIARSLLLFSLAVRTWILVSLSAVPISPVLAGDYYVDASAKESASDGSKEQPFLTVSQAASAAQAGGRVFIGGEVYTE